MEGGLQRQQGLVLHERQTLVLNCPSGLISEAGQIPNQTNVFAVSGSALDLGPRSLPLVTTVIALISY